MEALTPLFVSLDAGNSGFHSHIGIVVFNTEQVNLQLQVTISILRNLSQTQLQTLDEKLIFQKHLTLNPNPTP